MTTLVSPTVHAATAPAALDVVAADQPRLLVVDDEPLVRALMLTVLEQEGFVAAAACDAQEALVLLQEQAFDLILLDLCMPGPVDGEELLYALRDQGQDVPIIIISGCIEELESPTPECIQAVLKKPIRMDILLEQVRMALVPV